MGAWWVRAEICTARRFGRKLSGVMSAAAMNLIDRRIRRETNRFLAHMERERYRVWREEVERFMVVEGVRPMLIHIPAARWIDRYAANDDAYSAVVEELHDQAD